MVEMKKAADIPTTNVALVDSTLGVGDVAVQFLDTTWRIAVPVTLLAGLGIFADRHFGSKPACTRVGMALGCALAGWLVRRQLDKVRGSSDD